MYAVGVDVGSTTAKAIVMDLARRIVGMSLLNVGANIVKVAERALDEALNGSDIDVGDVQFIVGTGYGRYKIPFGTTQITEISCHAKGAHFLFPQTRTLIDIGGQDTKAILVGPGGEVLDFAMNDKCAAGTGRFLDACAGAMGFDVGVIGEYSLRSENPVKLTNVCTVFVESEIISHLAKGKKPEDILRGVHSAIASRSVALLRRVGIKPELTFTGGVSRNIGMVRSLEERLGVKINVHSLSQYMGAIGAALFALERIEKLAETPQARSGSL